MTRRRVVARFKNDSSPLSIVHLDDSSDWVKNGLVQVANVRNVLWHNCNVVQFTSLKGTSTRQVGGRARTRGGSNFDEAHLLLPLTFALLLVGRRLFPKVEGQLTSEEAGNKPDQIKGVR